MEKFTKRLSAAEAMQKIQEYCAYQERTHQEVRNKLFSFGLYASEVDDLITNLITEGFLNEERFAKAFVGGKFRIKHWGRIKIINALEAKGLTKNCIQSGLREIDEQDYQESLRNLLLKKSSVLEMENVFAKRNKLASYAIQKGFEAELVWKSLKSILPE